MPAIVEDVRPEFDEGPCPCPLSSTASSVIQVEQFPRAIYEYGRVRGERRIPWRVPGRRGGDRYVETFLVSSWVEHLRQHERATKGDREVEERLRMYVLTAPNVRHLVSADLHTSRDVHDNGPT